MLRHGPGLLKTLGRPRHLDLLLLFGTRLEGYADRSVKSRLTAQTRRIGARVILDRRLFTKQWRPWCAAF